MSSNPTSSDFSSDSDSGSLALKRAEERCRLAMRAVEGVQWEWDEASETLRFSDGILDRFGWDVIGSDLSESWWLERIHPEDQESSGIRARQILSEGTDSGSYKYRFRRADGSWAYIHDHFQIAGSGRIIGLMVEITERHVLEEQLRQAQKMDAVGRLAGGVAHDFNNLLTIIRGNAALLLDQVDAESPLRGELQEIERASTRASELTRQLLAFGRKQVLQAQDLDLNAVVAQMARMIDRLIPKSIEVRITPAAEVGLVHADRGQLEQVILNLVINARDAMSAGGVLELRTGEVSVEGKYGGGRVSSFQPMPPEVPVGPGKYIHLAVGDTGAGMDEETRIRAFEPFFTTKVVGQGTGLGLATVYGIVKQSDGFVWIDSTPGQGTVVHVLLPRVMSETKPQRPTPVSSPVIDGPRTILLVEDEDGVRDLARRVLERQGYVVLAANDGVEALEVWEENSERIDALVTDVVMPRLGGSELVDSVREKQKDLPVLFMSGYARNASIKRPSGERRTRFLQKPFTVPALQKAVAELLASANVTK